MHYATPYAVAPLGGRINARCLKGRNLNYINGLGFRGSFPGRARGEGDAAAHILSSVWPGQTYTFTMRHE